MSQWSAPWNAPKVQVDEVIEPIVEAVAPAPEVKETPAKASVKKSETPAEEE
jgi:hypothetical protein